VQTGRAVSNIELPDPGGSGARSAGLHPTPGRAPSFRVTAVELGLARHCLLRPLIDVRRAVAHFADVTRDSSRYYEALQLTSQLEELLAKCAEDLERQLETGR